MLSKKENNKLKEYIEIYKKTKENSSLIESIKKESFFEFVDLLLLNIDQLESDKQKLIEKLEKEKFTIESTYSQINGNYFMAQDRLDLIKEILEIVKGVENESTNKS